MISDKTEKGIPGYKNNKYVLTPFSSKNKIECFKIDFNKAHLALSTFCAVFTEELEVTFRCFNIVRSHTEKGLCCITETT